MQLPKEFNALTVVAWLRVSIDGVDIRNIGDDSDRRRIALGSLRDNGAVAQLLRNRHSTKSYSRSHLSLESLDRLLKTTVGSISNNRRPYGSAHGRYDVMVTVIAADVAGLDAAAYRYLASDHALVLLEEGDRRSYLAWATLDAPWLTECPAVLVLSADIAAAEKEFSDQRPGQGERFCWFEAGLIAQNIYLAASEYGLGTVFIGGLDPDKILLATDQLIPPCHTVLGMLPVGRASGDDIGVLDSDRRPAEQRKW